MKLKSCCSVSLFFLLTFFILSIMGCSKQKKVDYITVKGSDTMVHLVTNLAESYMNENPNTNISVTGGGSGTGIAALINHTTDICAASRPMKPKEIEMAEAGGVEPENISIAMDGIAVVVNPENPISEITMEQLKKIFTGAYDNWNQVGGNDHPLEVLSRESSSGTYVFFQEHVLLKEDYSKSAKLMPATASIIQAVSQDKWSIGYVGLGYALEAKDNVKILAVKKNPLSPAVLPSESTVRSGEYPIARPLYLYYKKNPSQSLQRFFNYCLSGEGQKIVQKSGYIPIK